MKSNRRPYGHVILDMLRKQFGFRLRTKHVRHLAFRRDYSTLIVWVADKQALPQIRFGSADLYSGNVNHKRAMQWLRTNKAQEPLPHK
jgi:hypothetical protein